MYYYVETAAQWKIIKAQNKRQAKTEAVEYYGRGRVRNVRKATNDEVAYFNKMFPEE